MYTLFDPLRRRTIPRGNRYHQIQWVFILQQGSIHTHLFRLALRFISRSWQTWYLAWLLSLLLFHLQDNIWDPFLGCTFFAGYGNDRLLVFYAVSFRNLPFSLGVSERHRLHFWISTYFSTVILMVFELEAPLPTQLIHMILFIEIRWRHIQEEYVSLNFSGWRRNIFSKLMR